MTKEELIEQLRQYAESGDTEGAHVDADSALLEYVNDPEIEKAYRAVPKWYA